MSIFSKKSDIFEEIHHLKIDMSPFLLLVKSGICISLTGPPQVFSPLRQRARPQETQATWPSQGCQNFTSCRSETSVGWFPAVGWLKFVGKMLQGSLYDQLKKKTQKNWLEISQGYHTSVLFESPNLTTISTRLLC